MAGRLVDVVWWLVVVAGWFIVMARGLSMRQFDMLVAGRVSRMVVINPIFGHLVSRGGRRVAMRGLLVMVVVGARVGVIRGAMLLLLVVMWVRMVGCRFVVGWIGSSRMMLCRVVVAPVRGLNSTAGTANTQNNQCGPVHGAACCLLSKKRS